MSNALFNSPVEMGLEITVLELFVFKTFQPKEFGYL